jgi:hypothetical protein
MGLSFIVNAGLRQRSYSQVRVPRDSRPNFTVSDSRLPQPGGPGPRIYIPQEQGGPVIPPGTGFPFRRLLGLAGVRWRYSTPPPHGMKSMYAFRVRVRVSLRLAVYRQSVRLGDKPLQSQGHTFFFQLNTCVNSPYLTSSLTRRWVCLL